MAIKKPKIRSNYTPASNTLLHDARVGLRARGLWVTLQSLPDNWEFTVSGLQKILPDGTDAIRTAMRALKETGYVRHERSRDQSGKYISYLELYDIPHPDIDSDAGLSSSDNPARKNHRGETCVAEHTQYNIPETNLKSENTDIKMESNKESPAVLTLGVYNNVILTREEFAVLRAEFADYEDLIDHLSEYMESTGRTYSSHYATIRRWAREDKEKADSHLTPGYYDCREEDSL